MDKALEEKIIEEYLGIPYIHLGRNKEGLDCWGLIVDIFKEKTNIEIFDLVNFVKYEKMWSYNGKEDYVDKYKDELWIKIDKPKFFDVVFFKNYKGITNHAGLYLSKNRFLHCAEKVGVVVNKLEGQWEKRVQGIYRYKGL